MDQQANYLPQVEVPSLYGAMGIELTPQAGRLLEYLQHLCKHFGRTYCYPGLLRMNRHLGLKDPKPKKAKKPSFRQLRQYLAELKRAGLLRVKRRGNRSAWYYPRLEETAHQAADQTAHQTADQTAHQEPTHPFEFKKECSVGEREITPTKFDFDKTGEKFDLTPQGLAQKFIFYQAGRKESPYDVASEFAEEIRCGSDPTTLDSEIDLDRNRRERSWEFLKRIKPPNVHMKFSGLKSFLNGGEHEQA
jgi:hypothetical protein